MHLAPSNLIGTWIALGLAFGSFVTVLVARVPGRQGLVSFSQCPTCNHPLAAKDNIPVIGFLILRGKCRYCKAKISLRYPLIELITAICVMMPVLIAVDGWLRIPEPLRKMAEDSELAAAFIAESTTVVTPRTKLPLSEDMASIVWLVMVPRE